MFTFTVFRLYVISESTAASEVLTGQYSRSLPVASRRGFIYDRCGNLLCVKQNGYISLVDPSKCKNARSDAESLSELSEKLLSEVTEKMLRKTPFILKINEPYNADGIYSFPFYEKTSVYAPHIVGYANKDGVGMSGIEKSYNHLLSGDFSGAVYYSYSADALGIPLSGAGSAITDYGYSESSGVHLTLDSDLQKFCRDTAAKYMTMGAVCVSDIHTGELLASVSLPDFDTENVAAYLASGKGELINRCAAGFTPGSVFKTVVAAATLESDISLYGLEYECMGSYTTESGDVFSCHKKSGHGKLTMKDAYALSCNPYFINLAISAGAEKVLDMAKRMGLGEKKELYGVCSYGSTLPGAEGLTEGLTANIAIGQGSLLLAPYDALGIYSCAAAGSFCKIHAVKKVTRGDYTLESFECEKSQVLSDDVTEKIREMMLFCTSEGLGKEAMPSGGDAGGKTATAQTGQYRDGKELLNSWFCGVYPLSSPKYVICVLCDGTGEGGNPRAVFREICEYLAENPM